MTVSKGQGLARRAIDLQLELSAAFLLPVLSYNALVKPTYVLDTLCTPAPSFHLRDPLTRFLHLSYRTEQSADRFYKGRDDAFFIAFWVVGFIFVREALLRWVWPPFAKACGVRKHHDLTRFGEQGWTVLYATLSWIAGLYIMHHAPYRYLLDTSSFFRGYPHGEALDLKNKVYYLVQTAFWIQQLIVLHIEEKRKDFHQMLAHHIVTITLVCFSYVWNWTGFGNAVLCLMDPSDILLSGAKMLLYTGRQKAADVVFVLFVVSWAIFRHVFYGYLLYSLATEPQAILEYAWRPREGYFWNRSVHWGFFALLSALQVILILWAVMIVKVAYRTITGQHAGDSRSEEGDLSDRDPLDDVDVKNLNGHAPHAQSNGHSKKDD